MANFTLSEQDVLDIRELLRVTRAMRQTTQQRPAVPPDLILTPETYVVLTPTGGIPARTEESTGTGTGPDVGDVPGSALCDVWQLAGGQMVKAARNPVLVNNFGLVAIKGSAWILVERDKYGAWWPTELLAGGGSGGGGTVLTKARWIQFTLAALLTTSTVSVAGCTVNYFFDGPNPGATATVFNVPASTNFIFSGASGHKGLAVYDPEHDKYWIDQLEC